MSKLADRLRRILHADDRLDREMAAQWEDVPADAPVSPHPEADSGDLPEEKPDWWISVPFRQGKGLRCPLQGAPQLFRLQGCGRAAAPVDRLHPQSQLPDQEPRSVDLPAQGFHIGFHQLQ